jgi:capsular exopolysaccharide synthesis family protein
MSRIDQARRRSSAPAGGAESEEPAPGSGNGAASVLERYVPERAGGAALARALPLSAVPAPGRPFASADPDFRRRLVIGKDADPLSVEQYRRLAATLHQLQVDRGLKTLMVTSAIPHEGKTLTIANLALTLSESYGRRVLLVDGDLRRPSIHRALGVPGATGLSDVLRSRMTQAPVVEVTPALRVLPAGAPEADPMALLASDRMRALIAEWAVEYDWVLVDAAPVGLMPDARLLADVIGAVLFVIGAGTTPYTLVQRAVAELGTECIVGTVLNRVDPEAVPGGGYYDEYYGRAAASLRSGD